MPMLRRSVWEVGTVRGVVVEGWAPTHRRSLTVAKRSGRPAAAAAAASAIRAVAAGTSDEKPLDLTPENVERVLIDARSELLQLFDTSVGITGVAELADLDGPFLKLRLQGRFWHQRSVVLARLANYLQKRIPEIVEVEIEDESQLDDSSANFGHS
ncbi:hypothetical protein GOP47_0011710 [Adiantum capillus-veneris]|uniref:Uncharacterized protein n=1 Tax=Adiantum capillus-veneris TaxID=13818 RepID=A0A9D4UTQ8_ADICA|nr:hypothetical protein GOP47_0011710 [Adiantum capillus-veneris]